MAMTKGNGANVIDARWIDTSNGMFIDITGLRERDIERSPGVWSCKNNHRYRTDELWPLRRTEFEGAEAWIPYAFDKVLADEYGPKSLVTEEWHGPKMSPTEQTVFRLTAFDGFENLQSFREPIPKPSVGEVLVRVRSVSLNYRDIATARGTYPLRVKDNVIPCCDMAGEVVSIGPTTELSKAPDLVVGDAVLSPVCPSWLYGEDKRLDGLDFTLAAGKQDGVLREYIAMPVHSLIKLPPCKAPRDFVQWAATPCTVSTVWNAFYGNTPLKPGDTVLVLGTGGVSVTALVLAKAAGATTIVTSSSDKKLDFAQSQLGADYRINYKNTPDWAAEVQRITDGKGVDHVIEVGGVGTMHQSLAAAGRGGVITVIGFLTESQGNLPDVTMTALVKSLIVRGVAGGSKQQLEEAVKFMGARKLELPVDKVFAFKREDIIAALNYVESGSHIGKTAPNIVVNLEDMNTSKYTTP
ncbi:hypothetical protein GQX73_g9552 [Xylaria multiplex]|uniref:Enoyl reductase (ER) domain-containing protein n=1 Tax=Xylaria multiplex TaxID=323545 RepID=A0A7C8IHT2_9PEZI|nr:hypothetical protein GQX73_g9552 [Xylaria multiplex]